MVRELALNFDVYLILFMVGALLDVVLPTPAFLPAWLGFKMALFLLYSAALPLNFLDHFVADLTTNRMLGRIDALQGRLEKTTDDQGDNHR